MATAMATTSIILALTMGFLFYLEIHKINKQVLGIQEQIHYLSNEVNKLKQQAKKKYYSNSKGKQVIQGWSMEDKGVGDSLARLFKHLKVDKAVKSVVGEDCGCDKRQEKLNKMFPYKK